MQVITNKNKIFQKFLTLFFTSTYIFLNCKKTIFFDTNTQVHLTIEGPFFYRLRPRKGIWQKQLNALCGKDLWILK